MRSGESGEFDCVDLRKHTPRKIMSTLMILIGIGSSLRMIGEVIRRSAGLIASSGTITETSLNLARSSVCRTT